MEQPLDLTSHRRESVKPLDVCFGMIKGAIAVLVALLILGLFGPTVSAAGDYLTRSHEISCGNFSVQVPLTWKIHLKSCKGTIAIEKRPHILFDRNDPGGLLFLNSSDAAKTEAELNRDYSGRSDPYQLSNTYKQCLRVDGVPGESWTTVHCMDSTRQVEIVYMGPASNLPEVATLVH